MKKNQYSALFMALLVMAAGIVGCNKEEGTTVDEGAPAAKYGYKLSVNPTFLRLADITVTMVTAEGEKVVTVLNDTVYRYDCTMDEFPATIKAGITYNWKADLDTAALGEVDLYMNSQYAVATYKGNGGQAKKQTKNGASINNGGVKGYNLYRLRDNHLRELQRTNYTVTFFKEGSTLDFKFD